MSDMVERVAKALCEAEIAPGTWPCDVGMYRHMARAAIAIVIEDCALVAKDELLLDAHGEPDDSAHNWAVERIVERIRSAPEDSATQAELEKLCSS